VEGRTDLQNDNGDTFIGVLMHWVKKNDLRKIHDLCCYAGNLGYI
jgi:hypothetical protein